MLTSLIKCRITFPLFGKVILAPRTNSPQKWQQHDLDIFIHEGADPSQEGVRSQQLCGRQPTPPSVITIIISRGYLTKTKATPIKPLTFLAYWSWWGRGLSVSCFLGDEFPLPDEPRTLTACCCAGHPLRHRGHKPGAGQSALPFFSTLVIFQLSFHTYWIAKGNWVPLSFISIITVCEQLQLPRAAISCVRSCCRGSHYVSTYEIPTQMGDCRESLWPQ